ncbi:general secretion pathway protein GspN [Pseudoluteimonas lycopersici]|uniref:General secretion pathway protein GspN n=1 Tax=Pseudoluteimonas lycopersici TaxID=1324796 RepID=A0A516V7I6_9GAMM|nr:general secretion pathway protein GspN [Lysobacter lycopersici]QDQ74471.1 general secretion pathway protein GspN [Lysobacter lycopersici]
MRLEDVSPRTWLLGAVAGWALAAWVLALAGMGGRVTPLADDPSLLQTLPKPTRPLPERLGPFGQYAEIAARPLFSQDRRLQPFSLGGDDDTSNDFDYVLNGVLLVPQVKLAMIEPSDGGDAERVKLGDAVEAAPAWRLVALNPRSAVFEGPGGQKTLELRVFDGAGGEPPPAGDAADAQANPPPLQPAAAAVPRAPTAGIAGGQGAQKKDASATAVPPPDNTEQQMEALRKRIEQRRAQLRAQQARQAADAAGKTDNP